jgi:hypothetical protein
MKWQAYRNDEATGQSPQPFSQNEARDLIRQTQAELEQSGPWPENLAAWLQENHPADLQAIRVTAKGIDSAWQNQEITGIVRALTEYKSAWIEGLVLWRRQLQQPSSTT